jgi:NADH:ubiquinone oxidoreductase subunit C
MKTIELDQLLERMASLTGVKPTPYKGIGKDETFEVPADSLLAVVKTLVQEFDCGHLSAITAQQRDGQAEVIEVLYHFWHGIGFSFFLQLPADAPELPSIISILPGADFYEREAAEMFGITFTGREETPPLLLPDDWAGGPPFIRNEVQDG